MIGENVVEGVAINNLLCDILKVHLALVVCISVRGEG